MAGEGPDQLTTEINHIQDQIDRRIQTQHRELADARQAIGVQIEALDRLATSQIEALEKRLLAILQEQRDATHLAEDEREKAAAQLRLNLEQMIREGDTNLRMHITEQVQSIKAALAAQERLGEEKDKRLEAVHEAAQEAIAKAEQSMERRLDSMNEFRDQLSDQAARFIPREVYDAGIEQARREREGLVERLNRNENKTLPREVFEASLAEWQTWRSGVDDFLAAHRGGQQAIEQRREQIQPWQIWLAGAVVTALIAAIVLFANTATTP